VSNIFITKEIAETIYDEKSFRIEVQNFLTTLIDNEAAKDEPDCDFIDDCVNTLECILADDYSDLLPFIKRNDLKNGVHRKRVMSILVACAILLSISFGAVAVNYTMEKKREAKTTTAPVTTESITAERTTLAPTTAAAPTTVAAVPTKMKLNFGEGFKNEYLIGEKLDMSGITVSVIYTDGTTKKIPISDCRVTADDSFGTDERYETVKVSYGDVSETFTVRVLYGEDTKSLNSVYALFPDDFKFTVKDLNNIDLSGMEVYAIYSDKSREKLSGGEYTVTKEILPDNKTAMITVEYKGVYTTFGIEEEK